MVLKADKVVAVGAQVLFAQLHNGPGRSAGARIAQAHRLHRPKSQGIAASAGQHFDGQAAFKVIKLLPLLGFGSLGGQQCVKKAIELLAIHGAINVISCPLVPARRKVNPLHVDGIGIDDGRDGVVKGQAPRACDALNLRAQRVGSERSRGQNREVLRTVLGLRVFALKQRCAKPRHLLANHANQGLGRNRLGNEPRELDAIHGQCVAGGDGGPVRNSQECRARPPHLLLEQPGRGVGRLALERVGADQFAELRRLVGRGEPRLSVHHGPHLVEVHLAAQSGRGQCCLRPSQSAANHANPHCATCGGADAFGSGNSACRFPNARSSTGSTPPANRASASPVIRTLRHASMNSAPMAR